MGRRFVAMSLAGALTLLSGCHAGGAAPTSPTGAPVSVATSAVASATVTPSATPSPSATPAPYPGESVESLRQQSYGTEGDIQVMEEMPAEQGLRRYRISYTSDGIPIDGYMNVPAGDGPHPVLVFAHGYIPPASYDPLQYYTEITSAMARAGYIVIVPSFRNHRGSGSGPDVMRIGYARDVMNLVAMARRLPQGDKKKVVLSGHSMGGGVALRVLAVMPEQLAGVVLYGAMNGDEAKNYYKVLEFRSQRGEPANPGDLPDSPEKAPDFYAKISPSNYLTGLRVPVQIHHGGSDEQVPLQWSYDLDAQLTALGTPHDLFVYDGQPHNLTAPAMSQMLDRWKAFFDQARG